MIHNQSVGKPAIANLLMALHIGEGIHRNISRDSIALERISHHTAMQSAAVTGKQRFPLLAEEILQEAAQLGPQVDTRAACGTAQTLFDLCVAEVPTTESLHQLRSSQSFLVSAIHRMVADQHAGIPVMSVPGRTKATG